MHLTNRVSNCDHRDTFGDNYEPNFYLKNSTANYCFSWGVLLGGGLVEMITTLPTL